MINKREPEKREIVTDSGNYNESIEGNYIQAGSISNTTIQTNSVSNIINIITHQFKTELIPLVENNSEKSEQEKFDILDYLNQRINEISSLVSSQNSSEVLTNFDEYEIHNIPTIETIQAHLLLAEYLQPISVRCYLVFFTATKTLEKIDINKHYTEENLYKAIKTFCDHLFNCLDWL